MSKIKMSEHCKMSMVEEFGFENSELVQMENFMNNKKQKTAKDFLDAIMQDEKLSNKQKIVLAYIVGNSARESAIREEQQKGIRIDMSSGVPPIGG